MDEDSLGRAPPSIEVFIELLKSGLLSCRNIPEILTNGHIDPCTISKSGRSILGVAICCCKNSDRSIIYALIKFGGNNLGAVDAFGKSPLHYAAEMGYADIVCLLLGSGVDVNVRDRENLTPLHYACSCSSLTSVECLLLAGADVNAKSSCFYDNITALHVAASKEQSTQIVDMLLLYGAQLDARNARDCTALYLAIYHQQLDVGQRLLKAGANVNPEMRYGRSILEAAVLAGNLEATKILLNAGAKSCPSSYLLHKAIANRNNDIACLLIDWGFSLTLSNTDGDTPLHIACKCSSVEFTKLLLENGADANERNQRTSLTPLHYAVSATESAPVFAQLICALSAHGAALDAVSTVSGETPLLRAFQLQKIDFCKLLVAFGSDPNFHGNRLNDLNGHFVGQVMAASVPPHHQYDGVSFLRYLLAAGLQLPASVVAGHPSLNVLASEIRAPPPLHALCRAAVRSQLLASAQQKKRQHKRRIDGAPVCGASLHQKIETLPLPQTLKAYLKLYHMAGARPEE